MAIAGHLGRARYLYGMEIMVTDTLIESLAGSSDPDARERALQSAEDAAKRYLDKGEIGYGRRRGVACFLVLSGSGEFQDVMVLDYSVPRGELPRQDMVVCMTVPEYAETIRRGQAA